jgi:hypothetical protein
MAQSSPVPPASQPPGKPAAAPAKAARSPLERILVWGGIVALILVVAYQAHARFGYDMTRKALEQRLAEDEGQEAKQLFIKDLDQYVVGWPSRKQEQKNKHQATVELTWPGLGPSYTYGMVVFYDPEEDGEPVFNMVTRDYKEPDEEESRPATSPKTADASGTPAAPAAGGPAAGAGPVVAAPVIPEQPQETAPAEAAGSDKPAAEATPATEPAADKPAEAAPADKPAEAAAVEKPAEAAPAAETPAAEGSEKKPEGGN